MFNTTAGLETPGRNLGYGADSLLAQLYGIPDPNAASTTAGYGANQALAQSGGSIPGVGAGASSAAPNGTAGAPAAGSANYSNFYNTPGYQFTLGQGEQAINRNAAAGGSLYSTNTMSSLNNYAQGQASTQYNNYVQQLMGLAGLGGSAVAGTAQAGTTAAGNISSLQQAAGGAQASGVLNSNAAITNALGSPGVSNLLSNVGANIGEAGSGSNVLQEVQSPGLLSLAD